MRIPTTGTATSRSPGLAEPLAASVAVALCIAAQLPHRLLAAMGRPGWVLSLVVVVVLVNGARALARAPFTRSRASGGAGWALGELRTLVVTAAAGAVLSLPVYLLLRATPAWWVLAWLVFAGVTVLGQVAMPLTLRAQSGPLHAADGPLAERLSALGARAGVDVGAGVAVAGKPGSTRCNAYVVGMGPTRRVVLESALAAWPPPLVDQVVAHELGHWRLRHVAARLPVVLAVQLATLALAAWVLTLQPVLAWAGVSDAGDPPSYPLLVLLTPLVALPARCVLAWRDRTHERAADRFALSLLRAPETFAAMLDRAADEGGAPRNLPWWRRLTASHPPIEERSLLCMRYASTA